MTEHGNFRVLEPIQDVSEYEDMKKDENMTDAERGLAVMLADLHGDGQEQEGYLGVYRETGGPGGNHEFLEKIPLDKYDPISLEQYVSDKYGPGDYRIHARVKGQKGIKGNKLLTIGAPKDNGTGTAMVPYHQQQQNQGGQSDLAMVLQQMNYQHQEMMTAFSQKQGGIVDSLADTIKSMDAEKLSVFVTLLTPVVKNLFGNKNDPMQQLQTMLSITGQVKDLQQDNSQEDDSLTGLAKAFLPALGGARQNDRQTVAETAPQKSPEQVPAQPAQDENQYLRHLMEAFKPMIDELLNAARENADPDAAAKTVIGSVQPDALPTFIQFMEREDSIYQLGQFQPAILSHAVWFSELRDAILDHYYGDGDSMEPGNNDVSTAPKTGADAESGGQHESPEQPGGNGGDPGADGETGEGQ